MDKQINTYLFDIDAVVADSSSFGIFNINQNYLGNGLITEGVSFRDDENITIDYRYPTGGKLYAGARGYGQYIADKRSNTLSELERFGGLAKLFYNDAIEINGLDGPVLTSLDLGIGGEHNERLELTSPGFRSVAGITAGYKDGSNSFDLESNSDYLSLNLDRENFETKNRVSYSKGFDLGDLFTVGAFYNVLDRDLLGRLTENQRRLNPLIVNTIENRTEERYGGLIGLNLKITDWLRADLKGNLSNANILRDYKYSIEGLSISNISRNVDENTFGFSGDLRLDFGKTKINSGISVNSRDEINKTARRFDITNTALENLADLESLRDNQQVATRFNADLRHDFSDENTLFFDYFINILRYDTPSELNNDDRDELTYQVTGGYSHSFSKYLEYDIRLSFFANHFVYLKSQFSSQNRWNRILSLYQGARFYNGSIDYRPSIDLIANYTSFDFEALTQNINSFSLRQINYSDTTIVTLSKNISLESNLLIRYYERGLLFWNDFAETPENANFERFAKFLIVSTEGRNRYGIGFRVYGLEQKRIGPGAINNFGDFEQFSYGPELLAELYYDSGNSLVLSGWYEYQNTNGRIQEVPNIFLTSMIAF
jgi:hypothetical protein